MTGESIAILILLISWLPVTGASQLMAYTAPLVVLLIAALTGNLRLSKFDLLFLVAAAFLTYLVAALHNDAALINPSLGLLTYSSMVILAIRFRSNTERLIRTIIHTVAWISIFECGVGLLQLRLKQHGLVFVEGSAGDVVKGTLGGAHSHLYAVKMLFQGLFLLWMWQHTGGQRIPGLKKRLTLCGAICAFAGGIFASFISGMVLFGVGLLIPWAFTRLRSVRKISTAAIRNTVVGTTLATLLIILFCYTQPGNTRMVVGRYRQLTTYGITDHPHFQKIQSLRTSITDVLLANPANATVGVGLGRYSSRAAMILSGGYLGNHPSWIPISRSPETDRHIYTIWNPSHWHRARGSIMGMPTSSVQSVLVEFGILGALAFGWYYFTLTRRANRHLRENLQMKDGTLRGHLLRLIPVMVSALIAISFTDLWLEYPSFMLFVYLLIAIALSPGTAPAIEPTHEDALRLT